MTTIKKSENVPVTPAQLFALVNAIETYPEFLPWCKKAVVHGQAPNQIKASMLGSKWGIDFSFGFIYLLHPNSMIEIRLMNTGPFRYVKALWRFTDLGAAGTKLGLEIEYEFNSAFLGWTLTPLIKNECSKVLKDFYNQARKIYGK